MSTRCPPRVLVDRLGLSPAQAGRVVEARERLGGFAGPEELIAGSGLSAAAVNALRERLLFVAVEGAAATHNDWPEPPTPKAGKSARPGWYPDPAGGPGRRYWDGAQWTDQMICLDNLCLDRQPRVSCVNEPIAHRSRPAFRYEIAELPAGAYRREQPDHPTRVYRNHHPGNSQRHQPSAQHRPSPRAMIRTCGWSSAG
jgi:hypothetical protein